MSLLIPRCLCEHKTDPHRKPHSSFASTEGVLRGGEQETLWPRTNKPENQAVTTQRSCKKQVLLFLLLTPLKGQPSAFKQKESVCACVCEKEQASACNGCQIKSLFSGRQSHWRASIRKSKISTSDFKAFVAGFMANYGHCKLGFQTVDTLYHLKDLVSREHFKNGGSLILDGRLR